MRRRLIFVLFLLSGAAGLIYEVIWVRQFGNIFGNTTTSASLVLAVFMCGLGLGSMIAGRWADVRYADEPLALLRMYARVEIGIAVLAALNALVLPSLSEASAPISSYVVGENGWHFLSTGSWVLRYLVATALLLPVTTLMGATLTLLIRFIVAADVATAGLRVGQLYSVNTLGAALGALATDRLLVPSVGLFSTQMLAVLLNLVVGLGASRLATSIGALPAAPAPAKAEPADDQHFSGASLSLLLFTSAAIFLAGFAAMGMEIVWFRHLSTMLGGYRSVFSLSLAVILLGIVSGSAIGGWLVQRTRRPVELFLLAQALFVVTALGALYLYDRQLLSVQLSAHLEAYLSSSELVKTAWQLGLEAKPMVYVIGLPAVLMGATFPLANASIQKAAAAVGRRAGVLYLANTVGGVLGSLLTGFVILPALGSQRSVALLAVAVVVGLVPMFLAGRQSAPRTQGLALAAALATTLAGIGLWLTLEPDFLIKKSLLKVQRGEAKILAWKEATTELVVVQQAGSVLELYTNGHSMSSSSPSGQRYMRAFSHLPLLMTPSPERVLVICFGVGNTIHAASLHPVKQLEVVDLSKNVLEHAHWFAEVSNHDVLKDPRVQVFINDGRQHLRMSPAGSFDLITLEPPPIAFAGVSALYSREFYELARSRLKPNGSMTQWLPAYQVSEGAVREMVKAFVDVFPRSVLLSGNARELILFGTNGPTLEFDPRQVQQALSERPEVLADLQKVSLSTLTEMVGTFAASHASLVAATKDALPLTDDYPALEYSELSDVLVTRLPDDLIDNRQVAAFCPRCFENGQPIPGVARLPDYLELLAQFYASDTFKETNVFVPPSARPPLRLRMPPNAEELVASSPYLQTFVQRGGVPKVPASSAPPVK